MRPLCLTVLLLAAAGGCDSPTPPNSAAPITLEGTFSLFAMDGKPVNVFCTVWFDPVLGDAVHSSDAYYFMYVGARLTFRPVTGEVDVRHRLVSCGGEQTETFDVEQRGHFERRESLILISYFMDDESYTDTAWLRGDTVFVRALRLRRGLESRGIALLAYRRDP